MQLHFKIQAARLFAVAATAVALIAILLHFTGLLASLPDPVQHFLAIKPLLSLTFCLLAASVFACTAQLPHSQRSAHSIVTATLAGLIPLVTLIGFARGNFDPSTSHMPEVPMSITAAVATLLLAIAVILSHRLQSVLTSQILAALALFLCDFNLVANLYGVNHLYGAALFSSMSVDASIAALLMSVAVLCLRPRRGFIGLFRPNRPGGALALRLLPAAFLVPTILGTIRLMGELLQLYDTRFGLALFTISNIAVFTFLTIHTTVALNRIEKKRIAAQHRFDSSERRYANIVDSLPELIWTCLPSGECDFLNQKWVDYTGIPARDQLGFGWLKFVHPDDLVQVQRAWKASVTSGQPLNAEYRVCSRQGHYRWFAARAVPLRDNFGAIVKWFGSSTDIHQLKSAESEIRQLNFTLERRVEQRTIELAEASNRLNTVLDAATKVCIIASDTKGIIQIFSSGAEAMLGYRADELIGQHSAVLFHDKIELQTRLHEHSQRLGRPATLDELFTSYAIPGNSETLQWTYRHKDGHPIPVQLALAQRFSPQGELLGFVGVALDISERIQLEKRLLDQNASLAAANLEAQASSKAKSEFLANMSHEIRTPMNGIIGMTGLLLDTDLSKEQALFTETVRTSGEALLTLINDILDFSKIESGKLDLELLPFELRPMMDSTVQLLAARAEEQQIELTCFIDSSLPGSVHGDPGRIRQVLLNLVGNAIKFTAAGEVSIRVEASPATPARIRFSITDTGIGIPADRHHLLFRAFSQVDSSTSRKFGGTGLGLAISKQLASLMGGEIGFTSQPGLGSHFWFDCPLQATQAVVPTTPVALSLVGQRILIVDDSDTSRLLLSNLLLGWGCLFEQAASPSVALQLLRDAASAGNPFQIAIVDYRMPEMLGDELARLILADPLCRNTRLLLMTSVSLRGLARSSSEAGFSAYLTKPIRQDDLQQALLQVLDLQFPTKPPLITQHTITESRQRLGRILLAEDNRINQMVAVAMLKKLGYWVEVAADGAEAIEMLKTAPFDLVLMDCQMPEVDGYTASTAIRSGTSGVLNPQIPIIAMTAFAMSGDREKCLASGMDDYLTKPVNSKDLAARISNWLTPKSTHHPIADQERENL